MKPIQAALPFALIAALIATGAFASTDSETQPANAQAAQPSTAPATETASPNEVVIAYFTAIAQGDREKALAQLWFANDAARKEAIAAIGIECAGTDFSQAADDVFPRASQVPLPTRDQVADAIRKTLTGASVDIEGNTAELIIAGTGAGGRVLSILKIDGQWKIDFVRMQRRAGIPAMDEAAVNATMARVKINDEVIAGIKAGRYKTAAAANTDLSNRLDALPTAPAPVRPASQPAATPQFTH